MGTVIQAPIVPSQVTMLLYVAWTATTSARMTTLRRYNAKIIEEPVWADCDPANSPKGVPVRITFHPAGWQRFCTERGLNRPAATVLNR